MQGAGRILAMDDEPLMRETLKAVLSALDYEVDVAADGAEAIELYRKAMEAGRPYDAVLMDLTVPRGMGGREAVQKLRAIDPNVRAIVSSGYSNDPIMANFRQHGFNDVVVKPYDLDELGRVLNRVLSRANP